MATVILCPVGTCLSQGSESLLLLFLGTAARLYPGHAVIRVLPELRVLPGLRAPRGWAAVLFVAHLLICLFCVQFSLWVSLTAQEDLRYAGLLLSALRGRIAGMSSLDGLFLNLLLSLLSGRIGS